MLYSFIPPILILLSLVGIILFLMKKAPEVVSFSEKNLTAETAGKTKNFLSRFFPRKKEAGVKTKDRFLLLLEKITRQFKIFFLKLENIFSGWGERIRNKRHKNGNLLNLKEETERTGRVERVSEGVFVQREERTRRPTISENVVVPRNYTQRKDLFENILIERIAANPKDTEAYERLGEYYIEIKNLEYAKECFKQVIKLDSKNKNCRIKMRKLEKMLGE